MVNLIGKEARIKPDYIHFYIQETGYRPMVDEREWVTIVGQDIDGNVRVKCNNKPVSFWMKTEFLDIQ